MVGTMNKLYREQIVLGIILISGANSVANWLARLSAAMYRSPRFASWPGKNYSDEEIGEDLSVLLRSQKGIHHHITLPPPPPPPQRKEFEEKKQFVYCMNPFDDTKAR